MVITNHLHIYATKTSSTYFFAGAAMTGEPPDGGNAAVKSLASNEPLDAKLPACCRNKRRS
jgi:hypothetical protein